MNLKPRRFAALSRQGRFQFWTVVAILGFGVLVASITGRKGTFSGEDELVNQKLWMDSLTKDHAIHSRADAGNFLQQIRRTREAVRGMKHSPDFLLLVSLLVDSEQRKADARRVMRPLEWTASSAYEEWLLEHDEIPNDAAEKAAKWAAEDPASGIIASIQGDLLRLAGEGKQALAAYERGAADHEAGRDSRYRALQLCYAMEWEEELRQHYSKEEWRETVIGFDLRGLYHSGGEIAAAAGDYTGLLKISAHAVADNIRHPKWVAIALLCGLVWFAIIHMAAGVSLRGWWRGLLAFGFGVLSIILTLALIVLQHRWFGVSSHDGTDSLFYCISGIGFREELAKLICFVPMLLFLRGSTPPAHVLALASCVGLGFAIEENVNYFAGSLGTAALPRLLTANFLHFALTGLTGLALWQAIRNPHGRLQHFTVTLCGAIIFHGLWDWHPEDPRLAGDYQWIILLVFAGLAYHYFGELMQNTPRRPGWPSPVWVFLTGMAAITAGLIIVLSAFFGFRFGFALAMQSSLSYFVIAAAMYYQLRRQ